MIIINNLINYGFSKIAMQNQQWHLKLNIISKLGVIVLSIVLLTGISFIPVLQAGVYAQQPQPQSQQPPLQQPQQSNRVGLSQVIKQVAQQVATANPSNNATNVYQILVQLAKQTAQTTSKEKAIEDIRQISSQVTKYPYGIVSQSLALFAQQVVSAAGGGRSTNTPSAVQIAQQITQDKSSSTGQNVTQSLVNKAVQTATGANSNNINQHLTQIAEIISKQTGVSVQKVESILIQLFLQIAQAQGQANTGQSISQIANQITNNPNGIFTQLILQLVKQDTDDNGKSSHTVEIIKTVVRGGGGGDININIKNNINNYNYNNNNNQPPSNTDTKTGGTTGGATGATTPALSLGNTPITTRPITVHLCFVCASGNDDVDYHRINNIATGTAQLTGVSTEAAELALSDIYLRTANKAGPDQASQVLSKIEAEGAADPTTLNKVGDLAKLYDSGYDAEAYQASDSIADKLSTGESPKIAIEETSIPNAVSLKADEVIKSVQNPELVPGTQQQSSLSGPPPATQDPNLIANPQEDPNLFQLSP
jgi:hypothetical protein